MMFRTLCYPSNVFVSNIHYDLATFSNKPEKQKETTIETTSREELRQFHGSQVKYHDEEVVSTLLNCFTRSNVTSNNPQLQSI